MATQTLTTVLGQNGVEKTGFLWKQGGGYRNWKKRYFMLRGTSLQYYKMEGDESPKGTIDLTTGRGVRTREQCTLEWPDKAKPGRCFGIAVEKRTFYLYGEDPAAIRDWMTAIQKVIEKQGQPTDDYSSDPDGKPESKVSKVIKAGSKMASKVTKKVVKDSGLVDEQTAGIIEGVADVVENQADADRDATIFDRVKMAGGDTAGIVADNVDNTYGIQTVATSVQEQCEADDDTSIQQRLLMAGATTLEGAAEIAGEHDEIAGAVLSTVATVARDQADADPEMSLQQRAILAGGSALTGASEVVEIEPLADTLAVVGGVVKDQAEVDLDTSLQERAVMAVGSTARGVADLESMQGINEVQVVAKIVEKGAEAAGEMLAEDDSNE